MEVRTRIGKNGRREERGRRVIGCVLVDRKKEDIFCPAFMILLEQRHRTNLDFSHNKCTYISKVSKSSLYACTHNLYYGTNG